MAIQQLYISSDTFIVHTGLYTLTNGQVQVKPVGLEIGFLGRHVISLIDQGRDQRPRKDARRSPGCCSMEELIITNAYRIEKTQVPVPRSVHAGRLEYIMLLNLPIILSGNSF